MTLTEIGKQVEKEMKDKEIHTIQELADRVGLHRTVISAILNGHATVSLKAYDAVLSELDIVVAMRLPRIEGRDKT